MVAKKLQWVGSLPEGENAPSKSPSRYGCCAVQTYIRILGLEPSGGVAMFAFC